MDLVFHPSLTALIVLLTLTPLLSCQSTLDTSPGLPSMTLPACLLKQVVTGTGLLIFPLSGPYLLSGSLSCTRCQLASRNLHTLPLSCLALTPETQAPKLLLPLFRVQ